MADAQGAAETPKPLLEEGFEAPKGGVTSSFSDDVLAKYFDKDCKPYVQSPVHGGSWAAHYVIREGEESGASHQFGLSPTALRKLAGADTLTEFYVEFWEYFAEGYQFPSSSQKMFRAWYEDTKTNDESRKEIDFIILGHGKNVQMHYDWRGKAGFWETAPSFKREVPTGRWVKFGLWVNLGTPGHEDGFIRGYLDDELIAEETGLLMLRGNDTRGFHALWWGGTVSYRPKEQTKLPRATKDSHRYMDDFRLYATKPAKK